MLRKKYLHALYILLYIFNEDKRTLLYSRNPKVKITPT